MNYDDLVRELLEPEKGYADLVTVKRRSTGEVIETFDPLKRKAAEAIQELQRDAGMLEAVLRDAGITIKRGPHGITWEWQSNSFGKAIDEAMQHE